MILFATLLLVGRGSSGLRAEEGRPISWSGEVVVDFMRVVSGDCKGNASPSLVRAQVTVDAERAMGWKGATFFGSVMRLGGRSPGSHARDAQGLSNIDGPNAWWIHEAWVDQRFASGAISVRAGLYDLSSEFDVVDTASLFLNSSHGTGPEFSQSGINGPSVFPYTSLGIRGRIERGAGYLQAVALDGVPGDPDGSAGTTIRLSRDDGLLLVSEGGAAGVRWSLRSGVWHYTRSPERTAGTGAYASLEGRLVPGDGGGGLSGWVRIGVADPHSGRFGRYLGCGLVWNGPVPGRERDALGLAVARANNGEAHVSARRSEGVQVGHSETAVELTYRIHLTDRFSLQPDVQWIRHPDTDPTQADVLAAGLRVRLGF